MLQTPDIIFSEWYSWDDVKRIPRGNRPGLYIIARFDKRPEGAALPNAQELLYIGETSTAISKRLQTFFKASQIGGMLYKHSGGNRFNRLMGNDLSNIYAAGFCPSIDRQYLMPFIYLVERQLIWDYIMCWGKIPECNGK